VRRRDPPLEVDVSRLVRDTKGAVYVEFLAAFFPLFIFFLALVQFIFVQIGSLITSHSAMVAARSAVVVIPDDVANGYNSDPGLVSEGTQRRQEILRAARIPLSTMGLDPTAVTVEMGDSFQRDEMVTVEVHYEFKCRVPGGSVLVCGADTTKTLIGRASMPNQGADYLY
jgi:hypothetical protein